MECVDLPDTLATIIPVRNTPYANWSDVAAHSWTAGYANGSGCSHFGVRVMTAKGTLWKFRVSSLNDLYRKYELHYAAFGRNRMCVKGIGISTVCGMLTLT